MQHIFISATGYIFVWKKTGGGRRPEELFEKATQSLQPYFKERLYRRYFPKFFGTALKDCFCIAPALHERNVQLKKKNNLFWKFHIKKVLLVHRGSWIHRNYWMLSRHTVDNALISWIERKMKHQTNPFHQCISKLRISSSTVSVN